MGMVRGQRTEKAPAMEEVVDGSEEVQEREPRVLVVSSQTRHSDTWYGANATPSIALVAIAGG